MIWMVLVLVLFILQIATILLAEYRHPAKSAAWLFVSCLFPVVGFLLYGFIARAYKQRGKKRRKARSPHAGKASEPHKRILRKEDGSASPCDIFKVPRMRGLLLHLPESPVTSRNRVEVLSDAASTYKAIFAAIEQARHFVHLEYYIVRDDRIGGQLQELLLRKAGEGVQVNMIVDGLGSYKLGKPYIERLRQGGVRLYVFLPPLLAFFDKRINYRNHRKIVVIDGRIGFLGGINIGDEYLGADPKLGYWRDTHLQVEGDVVRDLEAAFRTDWAFVSDRSSAELAAYPKPDLIEGTPEHVQLISGGPDSLRDPLQEVFFAAMAAANRRIYITTPYFIPDPAIAMALKSAAYSGVDVRIIFPAVPDSRIVHWATLSYVEEFMRAGVRFYQYRKGFMHAKIFIVDHSLASVGTANMDMRSLFSNFEIMAVLYERASIDRLHSDFLQDLRDSRELDAQWLADRPRSHRAKETIGRLLSPLF